ncbi:MAG: ABC transporter ATP-binding protein [Cytophagales bacterium]|nr:ABC transporter ATP-binding protein [Cytophagales bacterium]
MKPILQLQGVSKKFRINHESEPYLSLRERLSRGFSMKKNQLEDYWALQDVTFDVQPGDSVGIVGKNGAGKSTLLKILSKITPPTSGTIVCRGRIASLLEVGTGFHPELTGRENIFLNGSILGMRKIEIQSRFDEIVDFAETERFLDVPLKHYSSGMQLRLAFAVAAFLEPEILVIDEVLAVGDAEFQKKCLGKMEEVSRRGRTVLFVSHSMTTVQSLCTKCVYLEKGRSSGVLTVHEGVRKYLAGSHNLHTGHQQFDEPGAPSRAARLTEAKILNVQGKSTSELLTCEDFFVQLTWENLDGVRITPSIELVNYDGVKLFWSGDTQVDWDGSGKTERGPYISTVKIPANFLKAGEYSFVLGLYTQSPYQYHHLILSALHCSVVDPMDDRCLARGQMSTQFEKFMLLPALEWSNIKV